ncbi:MAG TPA: hypothetical protein V6D20_19935 [Candidatus Obscuribacterales bacterium]
MHESPPADISLNCPRADFDIRRPDRMRDRPQHEVMHMKAIDCCEVSHNAIALSHQLS